MVLRPLSKHGGLTLKRNNMDSIVNFVQNNWELISGIALFAINEWIRKHPKNPYAGIGHFIEEKIKNYKPKK